MTNMPTLGGAKIGIAYIEFSSASQAISRQGYPW